MKSLIWTTIILFFYFELYSQTDFLSQNLNFGHHEVGFQVFHEYDYSRTIEQGDVSEGSVASLHKIARPIQITVWYPADSNQEIEPLLYQQYIQLMATQREFQYQGNMMEHPFIKESLYDNSFIKNSQLEIALKFETKALHNAQAKSGKFPVLVWAPGSYGTSFENSTLFEFLASHGFVVASFPAVGMPHAPLDKIGEDGYWTYEAATRDLEFVVGFLQQITSADLNKLGIMGFSLGGGSAINMASRNIMVQAVASLDGSHSSQDLEMMPYIDLDKITIPVMNISGEPNRVVYDGLKHQSAYLLELRKFGHVFFGGSFWIMLSDHSASNPYAVRGTMDEVILGYSLSAEYLLNFFRGYLNDDQSSISRLKTLHLSKEIPEEFIHFEIKSP